MRSTQTPKSINEYRGAHVVDIVDLSFCPDAFTTGNPLLCSETRFKCRNGNCVDRSFLCNGQDNCQDNSDEERCLTTAGKKGDLLCLTFITAFSINLWSTFYLQQGKVAKFAAAFHTGKKIIFLSM